MNQQLKQKIVIMGDQSVGKTSIINRFVYDNFSGSEQPTVGIDFISKSIKIKENQVRLQLWDTAGQERFVSLIPSYIRDCNAALIVYDITNFQSFENISKWLKQIREERGDDIFIYLIGNKSDCERVVSKEQAIQKAQELKLEYNEVSAKNGDNILNIFEVIGEKLLGGEQQEEQNMKLEQKSQSKCC